MASINLNSAFFSGFQDTSGNSLVVGTHATEIQIHPRNTEPPAMPTLTIADEAMFHNLQSTDAGFWDMGANSVTGTPSFGAKGMSLGPGTWISSNVFGTGSALSGTWWADGIMSIEGPLEITQERYIVLSGLCGALLISYDGSEWRFIHESIGGDPTYRNTFNNITVPISNAALDAVPKPFYLRLVREYPASGTGEVNLVINDGTTTQTQTITGVVKSPNNVTPVNHLGYDVSGNMGTLNFYYFRQTGSNTATTPGTLQGTYWTTPTAFSDVSYYTTGTTSSADAGVDDEYWHEMQLNSPSFNNPLLLNGGGLLKVRAAASNTAPTGNTSADFSGTYSILQNIPISLNDPQGRYLKLELRFEPGGVWPLQSDNAHVFTDNFDIASVSHFATPSGANPVTLPVNGEGDSGGTLPFDPEIPIETTLAPRVSRHMMEYPYTVHRPLGTKIRRLYRATWLLNASDKSTLISFFDARRGGEEAFTWTAPGDSATSKAALEGELRIVKLAPGAFRVAADLVEVF